MKLTPSERLILSDFFESDVYKLLYKQMLVEGEGIAKRCLQAQTMEEVKFLQGQASALQDLHLNLKKVNKEEHQKDGRQVRQG